MDLSSLPTLLELPVVPLRGAVLFPHTALPVVLNRATAIRAIDAAGDGNLIAVATQAIADQDDPGVRDLHAIGTLAIVRQIQQMPRSGDAFPVVLDGVRRLAIVDELQRDPFLLARVRPTEDVMPNADDLMFSALKTSVLEIFSEVVTSSQTLPDELVMVARQLGDVAMLADLVASTVLESTIERQVLLAELDVRRRMEALTEILVRERTGQELRQKIRNEVEQRIGVQQRELLLREQLTAIRKELGDADDETQLEELRARLASAGLSPEAKREADREMTRLAHIPAASAEYSVVRSYIETIADLPWAKTTARPIDLMHAAVILDEDHFGLAKVKKRILEHLAVQKLKHELKGPILCLVGPPGSGKTSIGKSIARATGRELVRLSLGGIHDEAEIRGHRRTYVGALPGQILRGLRRAGARDPLFVLDEIDKLGQGFHGDPYAALLEVLDPEQNHAFRDNYLDVPFDLSSVMFLCTANTLEPIPPPLRDRMEVLELPGYIDEDKLQIAERYLVPREADANGVSLDTDVAFTREALAEIIRCYTQEAGVRKLEQHIGAICRTRARRLAEGACGLLTITPDLVHELLGAPAYRIETQIAERTTKPGVAIALAWTPCGGEVLFVESSRLPGGKGELTLTGHLGDVMQESARAALTWVRANAGAYGVDLGLFGKEDLHIHVPSGAVAKDGPSAGIVMAASLMSLFTNRPVRSYVALTGEITLSGLLLPVGGIKEKVLAARRSGIREVVLPVHNEPNVREDLSPALLADLDLRFATTIDDVLRLVLGPVDQYPAIRRAV
jgi:ATP-dependent Lon protease